MCGVIAALGGDASTLRGRIEAGVSALRHRGPDAQASWFPKTAHVSVGLGHARLATVAVQSGAQPVENEDGSVVVTCSGELYGDRQLRRDLEQRGHRFRTEGDCELIVHLYEEYGAAGALERLRGEFAFVLWDAKREQLIAARDPAGVRPLYFAEGCGGTEILFASEARGLFAMGLARGWNEAARATALTLQYPLADESLFEGVGVVQPGEMILKRAGKPIQRTQRTLAAPIDRTNDFDEAAREVRDALKEAVHLRMRAEVPAAALLSGGLDSTAVAAFAARDQPGLPAYTVRFRDSAAHDEAKEATASAAELGLDHRVLSLGSEQLLDALPKAVVQSEGLSVNHHVSAKYLLMEELHRDGIVVALTGEGADELFHGYAHLRADSGVADLAASNAASTGLMLPSGSSAAAELAPVHASLGFTPTWLRAKFELGRRVHSLLRPDFRAMVSGHRPIERMAASLSPWRTAFGENNAEVAAHTWKAHALEGYILQTLSDRLELAHAVEGRPAFLDARVVAVADSLPPGFKIRGGHEKAVLREALRGIVPEPVRTREKHPFLAPPPSGAQDFYTGQLDRQAFRPDGPFDREAILQRLSWFEGAPPSERAGWHAALMMAFSTAWIEDGLLRSEPHA